MRIKLFLLLGIFLFSGIRADAQSFRQGLKVGVDVAKAFFNRSVPSTNKRKAIVSFNANVVLEYKGDRKIGFTMEPGFIRKGFRFPNYINSSETIEINFDYIQLPVLFDYYVTEELVLSVGPDFAIHLDKGDFILREKFELSAVIGARYNLSDYFDVGLRYGRALTPSLEMNLTDANGKYIGKLRDFNHYFQLGIAYKI